MIPYDELVTALEAWRAGRAGAAVASEIGAAGDTTAEVVLPPAPAYPQENALVGVDPGEALTLESGEIELERMDGEATGELPPEDERRGRR